MNKEIISWGQNHRKFVSVENQNKKITNQVISVGNLNSYGDACIPINNNIIMNHHKTSENKDCVFSNETIQSYLKRTHNLLTGIPGKSNVTIAGAIAADTHGKDNLWGGSFSRNIKSIKIMLPNQGIVEVSRTKDKDIFFATIGGFGLTGNIISVEFYRNNIKFNDLYSIQTSTGNGINNLVKTFDSTEGFYWIAWINLLDEKRKWASETAQPISIQGNKEFSLKDYHDLSISLSPIGQNKLHMMNVINSCYYYSSKFQRNKKKYFRDVIYPLSRFTDTRNISNSRKIIQVQFSIPKSKEDELENLLSLLVTGQVPLLCSLKRLRAKEHGINLSFVQDGWTAAVDFAEKEFDHKSIRIFYSELIKQGGKIYLAKDSTLNVSEFNDMYPDAGTWKKIVKEIDKNNLFQSSLSKRLNIK
jgi:decaprenylphospho-beta-D-ribofuranose 2-oxidase